MLYRSAIKAVACAVSVVAVAGCLAEVDSGDLGDENIDETEQAFWSGRSQTFWTSSSIPACFFADSSTTSGTTKQRSDLRKAVETRYGRYANLNFTGWGNCTTNRTREIRVSFFNPATVTACSKPGESCCTQPASSTPGDVTCYIATTASDGTIRHEFGHALGFYHPEERPDYFANPNAYWGGTPNPGCEGQDWCVVSGDCDHVVYYGGYDPNSVMSYCAGTGGVDLSPNDIVALQHAYGFPTERTVRTPRGNCVAVNSTSSSNAFQWDCDGAAGQKWDLTLDGRLKSNYYNRCLGVTSSANGTPVKSMSCTDYRTKWRLENVEIRGYGGKCLDLRGGNTADGTPVQTWECLGNSNQKWSYTTSGEIKFGSLSSNKCLTVANGSTANGAKLIIKTCDASYMQRFGMGSNNSLTYAGRCIDVPALPEPSYTPNPILGTKTSPNLPGNGSQLQVWQCVSNQYSQKWMFVGALKSNAYPSKCMDLHMGGTENGESIQIWDCPGENENQTWYIPL